MLQPDDQDILSALEWTGSSQQGGSRRRQGETADHTPRDAQAADVVVSAHLTVKAVLPRFLKRELLINMAIHAGTDCAPLALMLSPGGGALDSSEVRNGGKSRGR